MSAKIKKSPIKGFSRNSTTGVVSIIKSNSVQTPISFVGYNQLITNYANRYIDRNPKTDYLGLGSNPGLEEIIYKGMGNHNDSGSYVNPIRANAQRVYINKLFGDTNVQLAPSRTSPVMKCEDRKDFLFYIDPLWDLNIAFTDVTRAIVTVNWDSSITTANTNNILKLSNFTPRFVVENSATGLAFGKTGRAYGIVSASLIFPELPFNSLGTTTVTITSNGSGLTVGGITQSTYTLPANKLKIATNAAQTYYLTDLGSGMSRTNANKGLISGGFSKLTYEYINGTTSTDNFNDCLGGVRVLKNETKCTATIDVAMMGITAGKDYYSNADEGNLNDYTFTSARDLMIFRPVQNVNKTPEVLTSNFYSRFFFQTDFKGDYSGNNGNNQPYYDYDTEKNFGKTEANASVDIVYVSDNVVMNTIKKAEKYGIWTFLNAFWSFQNYGYKIYNGTKEEITLKKLRAQNDYINEIMRKVDLAITELGYCLVILGNESNLSSNLQGTIYENSYGSSISGFGGYVYFADMDNQNQQANVNAMMRFYNEVARSIKQVYGNKVLIGPSLQMTSQSQIDEIIVAKNAGYCTNFDILFNNFYANGSIANPYLTYTGFDPINYWHTNQGTNKLNMILSECGVPRKIIEINNLPAGYNRTNNQGYIKPANVTIPYVDYSVEQGTTAKNLINLGLNTTYQNKVQGVILFGSSDNPGRLSVEENYGAATYESFFIPPKNYVSQADTVAIMNTYNGNPTGAVVPNNKIAIWAEEFIGNMWIDTPRSYNPLSALGELQATGFTESYSALALKETNSMQQVRTQIAAGVTNLIYPNKI